MISWMQKHRKYLVVTIWISTIAFVGAGFIGWGAYSFSADKANAIAKVGDRTISGRELQSSYNNIYSYYNQMLGGKLTQEKAEELNLQELALNQLIQQTLLLNYADELGITAVESEVLSQIQNINNFKKDGVFDKETYFKTLKAINKKAKDFENDMKKELIIKKLNAALQMPYTKLELETLGASIYLKDKLNVKLIDVQNSDITISDEALKSYWNDHKRDYMSEKSYTIEQIKVNASEMAVDEKSMEEFYNDNKHIFKGDDDKILSFEKAKKSVKEKVQLKMAKKEALKKYLAFKNGKLKADETRTLTAANSDIPLDKIISAKEGSYIKAIALKDGYITAKLTTVNKPEPLKFEIAKDSAYNALLKSNKQKLLEEKAKAESAELREAQTLDYLSRDDASKITMLSENEANAFLNHLFSQSEKKGYYIFSDKAIVYEIIDQKLSSTDQNETQKENLIKNIKAIKNSTTQSMLIKQLETRYKIEKY
jgi:peptidyl-prolyl cis-trans isomerase D